MIDKKATIKQQLKSKTNHLGTALFGLVFLQANFPRLESYLQEYSNIVFIALGLSIIVLRQITTKPVSEK